MHCNIDTFCTHIVPRCRGAPSTDALYGQIGEHFLLCRGEYMDLFYKHIATQKHSADKYFSYLLSL